MHAWHEQHIEQVNGPPIPPLTRVQQDLLLDWDGPQRPAIAIASMRTRATREVLLRMGLVEYRDMAQTPLGVWPGHLLWLTEEGLRTARLLRAARKAGRDVPVSGSHR